MVLRKREECWEGVVECFDVIAERWDGGLGEQTAEGVAIGGIEGAGSPQQVADVHEEAVEGVDVLAGVLVVGWDGSAVWAGSGAHGAFEGAFVGCEDGAEAGEGAEGGVAECEEVDCGGEGDGDADVGCLGGVRDGVGEGFVVGENRGSGG